LEGTVLNGGGLCTASCATGFVASIPLLSCSRGVLSPATFTCAEPEVLQPVVAPASTSSDDNSAVVIVSLCLVGFVLLATLVAALAALRWYKVQPEEPPAQVNSDPLTDWWESIQGFQGADAETSETCVFCGRDKICKEGVESRHGPPTYFRCCERCWQVLSINSSNADDNAGPYTVHPQMMDDYMAAISSQASHGRANTSAQGRVASALISDGGARDGDRTYESFSSLPSRTPSSRNRTNGRTGGAGRTSRIPPQPQRHPDSPTITSPTVYGVEQSEHRI